ncbi:hypothetical protein Val02_80680 [Virgisporangium aliadipatigenens]|uniref:Ankyrin repeat domain-containing protein n=1 Tax=Virgisporangium aliadipatigenens TaxID=741659 RepID=A0A8J3YV12_9ACTN|nr:hypothetical protein [Virgisporangium aliadipatigenens]GIJ51182.1 hypothetical protein Val02_80680 [Virgisporangium aliadipatigenens]
MKTWLTGKRYRLPARMLAEATERRAAGHRRGACESAGVDVDVHLSDLARHHTARFAAQVEEDLAHLVPDLLRWHFPGPPRERDGLFARYVTLGLALYRHAPSGLRLLAHATDWPQRLRVFVAVPSTGTVPWYDRRHLWDSRYTAGLRQFVGGDRRAPFFHRDGTPLTRAELPTAPPPEEDRAAWTEWQTLHHAGTRPWLDRGHRHEPSGDPGWLPAIDPFLPRQGRLRPEHLHPLVQESLFPDLAAPYRYEPPRPRLPALPVAVRVPCGGGFHRLVLGDGTVHVKDHPAAEVAREETLGALGATRIGCVAERHEWRTTWGARPDAPRRLRALCRHALTAARHGDADELHRLLDAGLDPALVRTWRRGSLLHLLTCFDARVAPALARRLVAAGIPVDEADLWGHTPLWRVGRGGRGTPELFRTLLDLGARPPAGDAGARMVEDLTFRARRDLLALLEERAWSPG